MIGPRLGALSNNRWSGGTEERSVSSEIVLSQVVLERFQEKCRGENSGVVFYDWNLLQSNLCLKVFY
jgi:hypothetical protein